MDVKRILIVAPPTPACFVDRLSWAEYLAAAMDVKAKSAATRPFAAGRFNERFSHCTDCTPSYRRQMCAEQRCHPPVIVRSAKAQTA